ncbi:hypothetical protein C8K30_1011069 [Promicromonospora sp. AC04]|uniref:hypothetical protein n=1 Tax=Promicromonospora sp. AC04 TaxID=2135723 RepID=UPI000D3D7B7E|nr:hypothetical protein [Promicromonospora sp. AC04]PUB32543.1 hypothetical protein C8K30_1011069 [Promicromonospora sp. AC04]
MSHMQKIGTAIWAVPGEYTGPVRTHREDGLMVHTLHTGETFRGGRSTGLPGAAIQRRAMSLADVTGVAIDMSRGLFFNPVEAASSRVWFVRPDKGAATWQHVPSGKGWLVTVSDYVPTLGYQHTRTNLRTWPAVLAFISEHFPRPTQTVTDDEVLAAVNDAFLAGDGEATVATGAGALIQAGITALDGQWYGREQNDYGQSNTYLFAGQRQAREWLDAIEPSTAV